MRLKKHRLSALSLLLVGALTWLSGCDDTYSEAIRYTVRTDPLFIKAPGEEQLLPDRPGQLPLYTITDVDDVRNPFHAIAPKLIADGIIRDPNKLTKENREGLDKVLDSLFGTPAKPRVDGVDDATRRTLMLEEGTLIAGSKLYRLHCLQCHGVTGDGRGPTARWVNPHPRDYRQGLFKFQSVDQTSSADRKPRRDDLKRVIQDGVEGTAMPAHNLMPEDDIDKLASYVIHLSIRGQAEFETLTNAFTEKMEVSPDAEGGPKVYLRSAVARIAKNWVDSQTAVIQPAPYPEKYVKGSPEDVKDAMKDSVQRGFKTFMGAAGGGAQASCVSCHKDLGRESLFRYDAWGTLVRPTNLTAGVYRGGRRPVDLYWRIHSGINGSGMVPFGSSISGEQIWDVVNFLQALPYPAMRRIYDINIH